MRPSERRGIIGYAVQVDAQKLLEFRRSNSLAVQASLSDDAPQAAVVGFAVSDALEIIFDTLKRSVISIALVFVLPAAWARPGSDAEITGTISTIDYGVPVRLRNAKIDFRNASGSTFTITTSGTGEYATSLAPGSYTISVEMNGFCPVHRPAFRATPNSSVRFDFTLTTICQRDLTILGSSDAYFDSSAYLDSPPYYFEENIPLSVDGTENLIIGFGKRKRTGHFLRYDPIPIHGHPGLEIPVTASFGTYTLQAHEASVDEKLKVLRAEGNVSVADGSDAPPHTASCVMLSLSNPSPHVETCHGEPMQ